MDNILLIGASGHARACIDVIEQAGQYRIAGLVDKTYVPESETILGYRIIGSDDDLAALREKCPHALIAIGQIKTPDIRIEIFNRLKTLGYSQPPVVSPQAYVSPHAQVGAGTIVMHGALVNAGALIGAGCIINNRSLVEHDARIGDHCHVSTGAILNGSVQIGNGSFIGSGAVIRQGIVIGERCIVGAGCTIKQDLSDRQVVK